MTQAVIYKSTGTGRATELKVDVVFVVNCSEAS